MSKISTVGIAQGAALALTLAGLSSPGRAAELTASGPSECAGTAEIAFRIERSIGMKLGEAAPLTFDVALERGERGYVAHIGVTGSAPGAPPLERVLGATDCDKLIDAVSVAVTLALGVDDANALRRPGGAPLGTDPAIAHRASATTALGSPVASAAPAPPPAVSDAGSAEPEATNGGALAASMSLWLLGDAGSLPNPSLGVALGAQLGWRRLELRALGTLLFEQETEVESALALPAGVPAPGAKLQLLVGAALACSAPFGSLRAPFAPFVCAGAEVGRLSGVGTGVVLPRRGGVLWAAPLVQVGASWAVPDTTLRLTAALTAAAPLNRDEFALRDLGTVHQPPSVVARLSVGVGVGFD